MADQFFRPGFTQGAWIDGEPWNAYSQVRPAPRVLRQCVVGAVWTYGIPGTRARSMYDAYEDDKKPRVRFGTSFTKSKENRFSSLGEGNPENTGLFNSDVNSQYFLRWPNNFRADGPIPIHETFDHGFELVASQFVVPKKWEWAHVVRLWPVPQFL